MSSLKDLYAYIKPYAPGVSETAIDAELVFVAKELASKTLAMRDTIYMDTQENWGMYELSIPSDRHLEQITKVCVLDAEVHPLVEKPCNGCYAEGFWIDRNMTLQIYPAPYENTADGIEIEYAYSPSIASCEVEDWLIQRYADAMTKGVLSRLLMMPNTKWYNPQMGARYDEMFMRAKVSMLVDGQSPFTRGGIQVGQNARDWLDS